MLNMLACTIAGVNMAGNIIPTIVSLVVNAIKIFVPLALIVLGMLDLAKAVMSNDEKEMKTAQTRLIKRVIYGVLVFLVISIVQLVFQALANNSVEGTSDISGCITCFTTGRC